MQNYIRKKYKIEARRYFVKPACVDLELFSFKNKKNESLLDKLELKNKVICVYSGKFGGIYLKDEIFEFIKCCINQIGEKFRFLLLSNLSDPELTNQLKRFEIDKKYVVKEFVKHKDVPAYLGLADFALCPVKPVPTKQYCSPIKNGEYWALGLPLVITNQISSDSQLTEDRNLGFVLKELSRNEYNKAISKTIQLLAEEGLDKKIRKTAEEYRNFSIAREVYTNIYGIKKAIPGS